MRAFLLAVTLVLLPFTLTAHNYTAGDITADHPWARATAGQAPNGAAYMTLVNKGAEADYLTAASAAVSDRVELHTTLMNDGVMQMREVKRIEVAPGSSTALEPGGFHVMLIGLKAPLKEGETFPLTLTFEKAGTLEVQVLVEGVGAMEHDSHS